MISNVNDAITYITPLRQRFEEGNLRISSIGAGYVGALTSLVLAAKTPNVKIDVCDVSVNQVKLWNEENYPFFEPGLDE